jgi:hypothetical protein
MIFLAQMKPATSVVVGAATECIEIHMKVSARKAAWRNLMVCAINAALEQGLFSLHSSDTPKPRGYGYTGAFFDFVVGGMPACGYVADAACHGAEGVIIRAAINPPMLMLVKGDAYASGCLQKDDGGCRLSTVHSFSCRNTLKPFLAGLKVKAQGYSG